MTTKGMTQKARKDILDELTAIRAVITQGNRELKGELTEIKGVLERIAAQGNGMRPHKEATP